MKLKPKSIKQFVMNFGTAETVQGTQWKTIDLAINTEDRPKIADTLMGMVSSGMLKEDTPSTVYSMLLSGVLGTEAFGIVIALFSDSIHISVRKVKE